LKTQKGTLAREKKIKQAYDELQINLDKILLEFTDELITTITFERIEELFIKAAKEVTYFKNS
jgi:hypothetical protein